MITIYLKCFLNFLHLCTPFTSKFLFFFHFLFNHKNSYENAYKIFWLILWPLIGHPASRNMYYNTFALSFLFYIIFWMLFSIRFLFLLTITGIIFLGYYIYVRLIYFIKYINSYLITEMNIVAMLHILYRR